MKILEIKEITGHRLEGGSLPDIDTDFSGDRRGEVKEYMEQRFGESQVCSVGSFTTLKLKGAIKDFSRQTNEEFSRVNLITSIISDDDVTMKDLFKRSAKEKHLKHFIKTNSDIFYMLPSILNQPKAKSIHPCAMIIFPDVMKAWEWAPMRLQKGLIVSEFEGADVEAAGFLKEDILGIKQLEKFSKIIELIKSNDKPVPDIYNLPECNEVYRYFTNGWNGDVFQLGTEGLTEYSKQLKPQCIGDLVAAVALFRPGPMENHYHEIYAKCKNEGREPKPLWGTEDITSDTYGLLCYQEQIMKACRKLGNLTLIEADDIRKAMGKKDLKKLKPWEIKVVEGAVSQGCDPAEAQSIWEAMLEFAKYGFNKSHAVAYAKTGYICQYLKVYYPIEYWTVALTYANDQDKLKYLSEIFQAKNISVMPPSINGSGIKMTSDLKRKTIYWGIESIKGIGENTAIQIIKEREEYGEYVSLTDFIIRHTFKGSAVKKQTYEALIACGAFDEMYGIVDISKRNSLIKRFRIFKQVRIAKAEKDAFTTGNINAYWWWMTRQKELTGLAFVDFEKLVRRELKSSTIYCTSSEYNTPQYQQLYRSFGGYVIEAVERSSTKGKFMRLKIESNYNLFSVMIWSEEYSKFRHELKGCENCFILFEASLRFDEKFAKGNQFTLNNRSMLKVLR